jgi:hypothetical protein
VILEHSAPSRIKILDIRDALEGEGRVVVVVGVVRVDKH